jgi:hypothetical protein
MPRLMGRRSRKRSVSGDDRGAAGDARATKSATPATSRAKRDAERHQRRAPGEEGAPVRAPARRDRRGTRERPPAPWGSFPLTELVVLIALVLVVVGFFVQSSRGAILLVAGLMLGSLAGLEVAVREHFAGYRSHTTLLSAVAAFAAGAVVVLAVTGPAARVPAVLVALAVFALAFYLLHEAFKRRSGGLGFR